MADRPSATSHQKPSADTTMVRSATARAIRMVARLGRIIRAATVRAITPSETTAAVARTRPSASHRPGTPLQTLRDRTGSFSYSPNDYPPFLAMSYQSSVISPCSAEPTCMDSRESGNNDIRLADEIHGVAKLKWYQRRRLQDLHAEVA